MSEDDRKSMTQRGIVETAGAVHLALRRAGAGGSARRRDVAEKAFTRVISDRSADTGFLRSADTGFLRHARIGRSADSEESTRVDSTRHGHGRSADLADFELGRHGPRPRDTWLVLDPPHKVAVE